MDTTCILLLLLCPEPPEVPQDADAGSWASLRVTAHLLEVWPLDNPWGEAPNFRAGLHWTRAAWRRTYGMPPASDIHRFPHYEYADECFRWACGHVEYLEALQARSERMQPELFAAIKKAERLKNIWWAVRNGAHSGNLPEATRSSLDYLRDLLGEDEYHLGRLPFHVPPEHFAEIR